MRLPILAGGAVVAISSAACGVVLVRTRARATGAALLLFALTLAGSGAMWDARPRVGFQLFLFGWAVCFAAALLLYPSRPVVAAMTAARRGARRDVVIELVVWASVLAGAVVVITGAGETARLVAGSLIAGVGFIADLMWRYERAGDTERTALLWMGVGFVVAGMAYGHSAFLLALLPSQVLGLFLFALVPPVLVLGIVRPHIIDVRGLVIEALVFEVVVVAYIALFVGTTSMAEVLGADRLPTGTLAFIAAIAAAGFHPLRNGLRAVVDELLFGSRPDPLDAATKVADRIGDDPVEALTAVREAMVLPFASLVVGGEELARSGSPVAHTRSLSLALGNDAVGEIVVGLRSGDLSLSAADERVLRIVAPLLAQTLRARSLASDLQASRGLAITAIEEERRRIRRDLHDGLGPTLSGIAFTADAARNSLADPGAVDALLRTLRAEASSAIEDIRRLVYGMRPPALDELGLIGALRQWAVQIRTTDGTPLHVDIHAAAEVNELPAATEVAAYRITVEALANVARHSGSDRAEVHLSVAGDDLVVDVRDHGIGSQAWRAGVGLSSMRERAAEIGGTVVARPGPGGGVVTATLPLR